MFFNKFIPELKNSETIKTKVNMYDISPNEDFILSNIEHNIIVGTGFSGHGFKFAPVISKILATLASEDVTIFPTIRSYASQIFYS